MPTLTAHARPTRALATRCRWRQGALAVSLSAALSCDDPAREAPLSTSAVRRALPGAQPVSLRRLPGNRTWWLDDGESTALLDRQRLAIQDSATWRAWWAQASAISRRRRPAIDFRRERVLVAAAGSVPSGTAVRLLGAALRRDTLFVLVLTEVNRSSECRMDGFANPAAIAVARAGHARAVVFRDSLVMYSCEAARMQ